MGRTLGIVFGLIIVATLVWLNLKPGGWEDFHKPSTVDLRAPLKAANFGAYIEASRAMIVAATAGLEEPPTSEVIEARLPFALSPDPSACPLGETGLPRRGVLLVHGLSDSPYLVRDVAAAFRERCYLARAVLLPGHGTVPGDLQRVGIDAWMATLRYGLRSFEGAVDGPLVLVGYSFGASLGILHEIEDNDGQGPVITAIVGFAPALHGPPDSGDVRLAFLKLVSRFPRFKYLPVHRQTDPAKYESFSSAAILEYSALQSRIGDLQAGAPVEIPFFGVISETDRTVPAGNVLTFFCDRVKGPRLFLLYSNDRERALPCSDVVLRASAFPEEGVLDITHVGITNAVANPIYGPRRGGYINCLHYEGEDEVLYRTCLDPANQPANSRVRYGEPSPENLEAHVMRRGMFNPDLEKLLEETLDWLDRVLEAAAP